MAAFKHYIAALQQGQRVAFRPRGNSMTPLIKSGELVTVDPVQILTEAIGPGDVVLCRVAGKEFLHKVIAVADDGRVQIGNNHGHINGWTSKDRVYGKVVRVEP